MKNRKKLKGTLFPIALAAIIGFSMTMCDSPTDSKPDQTVVPVTGVTLNKTMITLTVGNTEALTATVTPEDATNKTVTWSSGNSSVAAVSGGNVTALALGTAIITVTTQDGGKKATCNVIVGPPVAVTGVALNKSATTIAVGQTETLIAAVEPATATNKNISWTSSNNAVATVANGTITAVAVGTATITATTEDGGFTATCAVVVVPPTGVTGVAMNKTATTITIGDTETLSVTVTPPEATNKAVTWDSSDPAVATVANGTVTAVALGTANITATTVDGGFTASCAVTVTPPIAVTGVALNKSTTILDIGQTETLTATVAPANAANKNISWASNNPFVATVVDGTITANISGTATITVTTDDGGHTAFCVVTVKKVLESFDDITFTADAAPNITGPTFYLLDAPSTVTLTVTNPGQYYSIDWNLSYNGITHLQGPSFTLNSTDFDVAGEYILTVEVIQNGVPYNRTITITVED